MAAAWERTAAKEVSAHENTAKNKTFFFLSDYYPWIYGGHFSRELAFNASNLHETGGRRFFSGRSFYGDILGLRDRTGRAGHGDVLVRFRAGGDPVADPGRRHGCDHGRGAVFDRLGAEDWSDAAADDAGGDLRAAGGRDREADRIYPESGRRD